MYHILTLVYMPTLTHPVKIFFPILNNINKNITYNIAVTGCQFLLYDFITFVGVFVFIAFSAIYNHLKMTLVENNKNHILLYNVPG